MFENLLTTPEALKVAEAYAEEVCQQPGRYHNIDILTAFQNSSVALFEKGAEGLEKREPGFFVSLMDEVVEFWVNFVPHKDAISQVSFELRETEVEKLNLTEYNTRFLHLTYLSLEASSLAKSVEAMLKMAAEEQVSATEFKRWVERGEKWMLFTGDAPQPVVWLTEYDVAVVKRFKSSRWDSQRDKVLHNIVVLGQNPEDVFRYGVHVTRFLTPEQVQRMNKISTPKAVKSLFGMDTHGRQKLTPELLFGMVEVGFESANEVRDYARAFGVDFTDGAFYDRVTSGKKKYPVLSAYVPAI